MLATDGDGSSLTALDATVLSGNLPAISGASLTSLTATNLGSGTVPTARLGSGTASSSTVLYGDQTYKAEPGGTNTPAFARDSGGGNVEVTSKNTWTLVTNGTAIIDTDSDYTDVTGAFLPSSAGNYLIYGMMSIYADQIQTVTPAIYRNGVEYIAFRPAGFNSVMTSPAYYLTSSAFTTVMNFNGTSDYIQMYINANWGTGSFYINGRATFGAIKIIE